MSMFALKMTFTSKGCNQMNRYAFYYLMKADRDRVCNTVPHHIEYWKSLAPPDYKGGPFADRSGGLITFSASSETEAERIVSQDPFVNADALHISS